MNGERVWRSAVPLPGGDGLYLGRDGAKMVFFLLQHYATVSGAINGLADVAKGSQLAREVAAACQVVLRGESDSGRVVWTSDCDGSASPQRPDDLLTMAQVAEELNVTDRTARRLAEANDLGVVTRPGRAKLVRRFEVDAYRNRRTTSRGTR